jgi:hypothetical protein
MTELATVMMADLDQAVRDARAEDLARDLTSVPERWFDDVDPATTWLLCWLEHVDHDVRVRHLLGRSLRAGYRLGRHVHGADDHPSVSRPAMTDAIARVLGIIVADLAAAKAPDQFPGVLERACDLVAAEVRARGFALDNQSARAVTRFGVHMGVLVAMAEHEVATD